MELALLLASTSRATGGAQKAAQYIFCSEFHTPLVSANEIKKRSRADNHPLATVRIRSSQSIKIDSGVAANQYQKSVDMNRRL